MSYCVLNKKVIIFAGLLILNLSNLFSFNPFEQSGFKIVDSQYNSLTLSYDVPFTGFDTIYFKQNGIEHMAILPLIKESYIVGNEGDFISTYSAVNITVPSEKGFFIQDFKIISSEYYQGQMAPIPTNTLVENYNNLSYKYNPKPLTNSSSSNYKLEYLGIAQNRHLASLQIKSSYYNGKIIIPQKIIIKIGFDVPANNIPVSQPDLGPMTSINHLESLGFLINNRTIQKNKSKKDLILADNQVWLKLKVDKDGVYRINSSDLSALGYTINKEDIPKIKIYGHGGVEISEFVPDAQNNDMSEQAIIVRTNTSGDLDKIIFFGAAANGWKYYGNKGILHYINHYSNSNYYLLTWKGEPGKRAEAIPSVSDEPVHRPTTYTNLLFFEEEMHNAYSAGSGRQWFGRNLLPATFTEQLTNLDRNGQITYKFSVAHRASRTGTFSIKENNKDLATISLNPVSGYYDAYRTTKTFTHPASIVAGDNRSTLSFNYSNEISASSALGYFDWFEIHYPAQLVPIDNQITFFSDLSKQGITEYSINNFSNSDIIAYDITNIAQPVLIENKSTTGGMFVFKTNVDGSTPSRYFISANLKKPEIEKIELSNLRSDFSNSDMILVTHPQLLESALKYKEYREKQSNIKVDVVKTDDIFTEFSSCIPDPTAIRDFVAFAYNNWESKPRFVLLWGDGHYDYKHINTNATNFVPTYQTEDNLDSFYEIDSYTSDDYFANIVGDDNLIDIAIGRLPIYSNTSGLAMLEKISHYENNSSIDSWRTNLTIVADDSWKSEGYDRGLHTGQAESLWSDILPSEYITKKIYLPEYPTTTVSGGRRKPRVMEDIISTVNTGGSILLCYIGHGNPRVWTHEEVFERSISVPQMKNLDKLFFLTAASCDFGRFDAPEVRSGAEELILSPVGGSIGTYSSTRLVFAEPNARLNEHFYTNIFSRNPETGLRYTLGEVNYLTKIIRHTENDQKYCLLGDPSLKLLLPDYHTIIDSINSISVAHEDTAFIEALSKITIKGHITSPSTSITDETFNGTVIINMLDCDQYMEVFEDDESEYGTIHRYWKNGGALNRSSYKVENGKFTAEFYIPKDISFAYTPGRLYAYAYTEDNRFSNGDNRQFIISGIDDADNADNIGPDIDIYFDSRDFVSGEVVRCTPLLIVDLSDSSGINTTGLGLGHRIEAWIDDSPNSIDLTENFRTSINDSRSGSVEILLFSLKPGLHEIKIRAWDVFNNFSEKTTMFRITDCNSIVISNLLSYPNPALSSATIKFNHNISPPFNAELLISNMLGQTVKSIKKQITTSHTAEFEWNGFDNYNESVPSGNYLYIINVEDADGTRNSANNILTIIR